MAGARGIKRMADEMEEDDIIIVGAGGVGYAPTAPTVPAAPAAAAEAVAVPVAAGAGVAAAAAEAVAVPVVAVPVAAVPVAGAAGATVAAYLAEAAVAMDEVGGFGLIAHYDRPFRTPAGLEGAERRRRGEPGSELTGHAGEHVDVAVYDAMMGRMRKHRQDFADATQRLFLAGDDEAQRAYKQRFYARNIKEESLLLIDVRAAGGRIGVGTRYIRLLTLPVGSAFVVLTTYGRKREFERYMDWMGADMNMFSEMRTERGDSARWMMELARVRGEERVRGEWNEYRAFLGL